MSDTPRTPLDLAAINTTSDGRLPDGNNEPVAALRGAGDTPAPPLDASLCTETYNFPCTHPRCPFHGDAALRGNTPAPPLDDFTAPVVVPPGLRGGLLHKPGESHQYRLECEVCGQPGVVRVSIDPEREP